MNFKSGYTHVFLSVESRRSKTAIEILVTFHFNIVSRRVSSTNSDFNLSCLTTLATFYTTISQIPLFPCVFIFRTLHVGVKLEKRFCALFFLFSISLLNGVKGQNVLGKWNERTRYYMMYTLWHQVFAGV